MSEGSGTPSVDPTVLEDSGFYAKAKASITQHPDKYIFGPRVALVPGMPLSGKTTLVSRLAALRDSGSRRRYLQVKRVTTRVPRVDESPVASDVLTFVSDAEFNDHIRDGRFLFSYRVDGGGRNGILLDSFSRERVEDQGISPDAMVLVPVGRPHAFERYNRSIAFSVSPRILVTTKDTAETLRNRAMRRMRVHDSPILDEAVEAAIRQRMQSAVQCRTDFDQLLSPEIGAPTIDCVVENDFPFENVDVLASAPPDIRSTHFEAYYLARVRMMDSFLTSYASLLNHFARSTAEEDNVRDDPDKMTFLSWNDVFSNSSLIGVGSVRHVSPLYDRMVHAQLEKLFGQGATYPGLTRRVNQKLVWLKIPSAVIHAASQSGPDERFSEGYVKQILFNKKRRLVKEIRGDSGVLTIALRSPISMGVSPVNAGYSSMAQEYNTMIALLASVLRQSFPIADLNPVPPDLRFYSNGGGSQLRQYDPLAAIPAPVSTTVNPEHRLKSIVCDLSSRQIDNGIYRMVIKPAGT